MGFMANRIPGIEAPVFPLARQARERRHKFSQWFDAAFSNDAGGNEAQETFRAQDFVPVTVMSVDDLVLIMSEAEVEHSFPVRADHPYSRVAEAPGFEPDGQYVFRFILEAASVPGMMLDREI